MDGRPAAETQRVGIGNYCRELLRAFGAVNDESAAYRVYVDREPGPDFPRAGENAEVRVLPRCRGWTQRALARELRQHPPDVFLAPGIQIPIHAPCPTVPTALDLAYITFPEHFTLRTRMLNRFHARLAFRRAAHTMAISEATKRDVVRLFGLRAEDVTVVHLGVSAPFLATTKPEMIGGVRKRLELPERYVLYVGTLQPRKNLVRLIEAFGQLREKHPDLPHHLVLAGQKGWLYKETFDAAKRPPARRYIHFLDYVPPEDLPALMAGADALALVSLWEGFGLPVVEAMACGTAVLTSDCSSLPEVAGDAALSVDPYDTGAIAAGLERLLLDDAFRQELEVKGRAQAAHFTWERAARTTLNVLQRVARGANGS